MSKTISKKNKLIQFLGISMVALLLGSYVSISAIDNPYQAGETLDPNCVPGEVNCTVEIGSGSSEWITSGEDIYFTGGNVGIGNNNPTSLLDLTINSQTIYEQYFSEDDGNDDSLDDATFFGTYTGDVGNGIQVWIDSEGAPDTFSYSDYNGDCPEVNNVPITGSSQSLCLGMSITFASITGHSISDYWYYDVYEGYQNPLTIKDDQGNIHFDLDVENGTLKLGEYYLPLYSGSNGQVLINNGNGYVYWDTPSAGLSPISAVGTYGLSTSSWDAGSANYSNFLGNQAGYQATTAAQSNFLGFHAGNLATNAYNSNFLGFYSGNLASSAYHSNFIGFQAGNFATNAMQSNFFGSGAGEQATNASYSNFFGLSAGGQATNAYNSNFFGLSSGGGAVNASNSIFIGKQSGYQDTVNNTTDPDDWSILVGYNTNTGGFKNSILLGGSSGSTPISNTKANQFMLASSVTEMRLRGVDYTLPSSQGGASTVLTNDGSGGLTWASAGGGLSSDADFNTKGGTNAGLNLVAGAQYNTFIGYEAGKSAVVGGTNTADRNTSIGYQSLYSNTTGAYNTVSGYSSLYSNTTGGNNTASGHSSLYSNTTGGNNTVSGYSSLYSNTMGHNNVAAGSFSLSSNITGSSNIALGVSSGRFISNGINLNTTGDYSVFIGAETKAFADDDQNEIVIGYNAIGGGSNTATIGNTSLLRTYLTGVNLKAGTATAGTAPLKFTSGTVLGTTEAGAIEYDGSHLYFTATNGGTRYQLDQQGGGGLTSDADFNTKGGTDAGLNFITGAQNNTFLGYEAGKGGMVTNVADYNTAIGFQSLYSNTTGASNSAIGSSSLYNNTTGYFNIAVGDSSLYFNTSGNYNTANGYRSLYSNTTGSENTANGFQSLYSNTTGYNNTANGFGSLLSNSTAYNNTATGYYSLSSNDIGTENTASGSSSLMSNISGSYNTVSGSGSMQLNTTGSNNTASGFYSLINNVIGYGNTAIGSNSLYYAGKTVNAGSFITGVWYTITWPGTTDFTLIGAGDSEIGTVFEATGPGTGDGTAVSEPINNIALGYGSGISSSDDSALTSPFNSLFLGVGTKALIDAGTNEIVIGNGVTGNGSNTTTIGTGNVLYVGGGSISGVTARFTNSAGYCDINPTTATLACTSDVNLKKNIVDLNNEDFILNENIETPETILKKILTLTPVMYNWNTEENNKEKHIGLIAQEVEQLFPDIVSTDSKTSIKSIAYSNLIPYTIKAIQELDLKVEEIKVISPVSLGEMLSQFGDSVLLNIENGIAYLKDIAVETLRVGSPERRTGITLYDEETGDPYCLSISNGEQKIVSGECSIFEEEEATEEDLPVVEDESDSDIEDETQEEISIEGDIEATSEEEQSEKSTENQTEEQVLVTEEESSIDPMVEEEFDTAIFE